MLNISQSQPSFLLKAFSVSNAGPWYSVAEWSLCSWFVDRAPIDEIPDSSSSNGHQDDMPYCISSSCLSDCLYWRIFIWEIQTRLMQVLHVATKIMSDCRKFCNAQAAGLCLHMQNFMVAEYFNGLVQNCSVSSAYALEILQSCTEKFCEPLWNRTHVNTKTVFPDIGCSVKLS